MNSSTDLVVLGAGPAGLSAAWRAARRGLSVVVLDRSDAVGGMAASFDVAGIRVDYGSHRLNPDMPAYVLADLRYLLGGDLQTRYRDGRLLLGNKWITYPFKPRELARALPAVPMARAAFEAIATPWRRSRAPENPESYAELMRAGFGPTLYEQVYAPYARKLWGLAGHEIDVDQARRKAGAPTALAALVRSVRSAMSSESLAYLYPRRGFGQLSEALADAALTSGARLRLGAVVERLDVGESDIAVRLGRSEHHIAAAERGGWSGFDHWEASGWLRAKHVFSTLPLPLLARMTSPGAPYEAVEASGNLRFRAIVLVYAVHRGSRWTKHDVHYIPASGTPVSRISEPANHRINPEDPEDRSVVCFELPCDIGDEIWDASDDELLDVVGEAVQRTGLPPLNLDWLQVKRLRNVYPVYQRGYRDHLAVLEEWVDRMANLTSFGRLGLFTPDNTHHAMVMGYEAADALGSGKFDKDHWSAARDRFAHNLAET
ncbi:MAG TPA: FAD-dependent oxidoreductase [Actinocrinis sp.]|uniref:FAD-dependent oxidoreductase n=1 Tax=Actinocrinis sp. TaxID=1920516 RepID=UPI002DDD8185|nr:FAD-dependent oxidoreductase [Actinocrinis sp.]HEV2343974.1 FAD-dependent oxidoreductase [Actinocrinis sp.]